MIISLEIRIFDNDLVSIKNLNIQIDRLRVENRSVQAGMIVSTGGVSSSHGTPQTSPHATGHARFNRQLATYRASLGDANNTFKHGFGATGIDDIRSVISNGKFNRDGNQTLIPGAAVIGGRGYDHIQLLKFVDTQ